MLIIYCTSESGCDAVSICSIILVSCVMLCCAWFNSLAANSNGGLASNNQAANLGKGGGVQGLPPPTRGIELSLPRPNSGGVKGSSAEQINTALAK